MKLISEFKEFIARGNVIDLAVAVIIGASFGKIVNALVDGVIMPPIGLVLGNADFSDLFFALDGATYQNLAAAQQASAPVIAYGQFITTVIQFLIVAACVFALVKVINRLKRTAVPEEVGAPPAPPEPTASEKLLTEIRDLLKSRS